MTASERRSGAFAFSVKPFGMVTPQRTAQSVSVPSVAGPSGLKRLARGSKDTRDTIDSISARPDSPTGRSSYWGEAMGRLKSW